jgi:hypothetical protein
MPVTTITLDPGQKHHRRGGDGELQPKPVPVPVEALAEPKPGEPLPPSADPDFVEGPPPLRATVTITLQPRHHEWLLMAAAREGRTPENMAEALIRQAYAADPMRVRSTLPQGPGQPAGTARR